MSTPEEEIRAKVGLVLGGGGVLGAAWLLGALAALVSETGWNPATADLIVGTSAGSIVGTLIAADARPWTAVAEGGETLLNQLLDAATYRPQRPERLAAPGSWELAQSGWRSGSREALTKVIAGLAPEGVMSTEPVQALVRRCAPRSWPATSRLWLVATDYETGERVVFGAAGAPPAELADAVAASCAVPGFYRPVEINGRRYIDGGVNSAANLDLVAPLGLDLVLCFNPLSSAAPTGKGGPLMRLRARLHKQLLLQASAVVQSGARLVLVEPTPLAARLIGFNPMSRRRGEAVARAAVETTTEQLRTPEIRRMLALLPFPRQSRETVSSPP